MFLQKVIERNPDLIEVAFYLHRKGFIEPDTYVIDLDQVGENAKKLADISAENNFNLYFMTKQIGRNPLLARTIAENGIKRAVAVDPWEARTLDQAGVKLGNVGHLVQVPSGMIEEILQMRPEVITVYSVEKAARISQVARKLSVTQPLLLKVIAMDGFIYSGQEGGFTLENLLPAARDIAALPNVTIAGVTSFPCLLFDYQEQKIKPTANLETLLKAAEDLRDSLDINVQQINAPSVTCCRTIPLLKEMGCTHGEPGHALTGTTPYHAYYDALERPALVYLSEVSHLAGDSAYAYGGGFYQRSHLKRALIGNNLDDIFGNIYQARAMEPEMIDYYNAIQLAEDDPVQIGDTVIYSFRTQIFVTRSKVAVVRGIDRGVPELAGIYDSQGRLLKEGVRI